MRNSAPSFTGCEAVLIVELMPSHRLLGLVLALHAVALLPALLWSELAVAARIGWVTVVGALCYRELTRHGWARPETFVHRLGRMSDGYWFFEANGIRHGEAVVSDRLVAPGVCVLRLASPEQARTVVVPTDATDQASHRRLRAALLSPHSH